ncbi:MAG: hypothetical protein ACK4G5_00105 [Devosia sp.]|jgi:hypothetical protein|nr:hypothetical protein [Alphaproteobacteria bacterium]MBU1562136.1 hypothetical protein [Alphaproteobacteria bacterium]MBU2301837.1 hypothetical protein [Alphaproteobacteria bacterium]MBU2368423.1 hypothetical protein [Alphaproteobacteria bacterium]
MIGWLKKRLAAKPQSKPQVTPRVASPENCALWHDVARALDAKPRTSK